MSVGVSFTFSYSFATSVTCKFKEASYLPISPVREQLW